MSRRGRQETENLLIEATGRVLARDGFMKIGVNAVAREAGVDKVLIYRYFKNLDGLVSIYAAQGDFWPNLEELIGPDKEDFLNLTLPEQVSRIFSNMIDGIRSRPLTLEILAWEMIERNQLTAHLEEIRESLGHQLTAMVLPGQIKDPAYFQGMTAMIAASINYLASRSRHIRIFNGINLKQDEGWDQIKQTIQKMAIASL